MKTTVTIECRDAAHVRQVELALKAHRALLKLDDALMNASRENLPWPSPHNLRVNIRKFIREAMNVDATEFGLPEIKEGQP